MNSRGFNYVLFCIGDRKKSQKKEQAQRVKRWQKVGRGQKAHCKGQKCPQKGGERKESHHWLVPHSHCKRRGVHPRMTDVPGHCFHSSLLSASCFGSGIPWDSLRLWESFNAPRIAFPTAILAVLSGRIPRLTRWGKGYTSQEGLLVGCQMFSYYRVLFPSACHKCTCQDVHIDMCTNIYSLQEITRAAVRMQRKSGIATT